ncbi:protein-L-isoaspartate(D-aspartate) O-methyltransferase [Aureibaculum sp. 2210JD6-5]|uniref:protein-L-isoaspartate(D-aspartate) O-methyltransferase n=1 Tax=Aureibaculum sp. 2210JD6-5 TaxID=3103957 RepID=UPI002AAC90B5|nr:protein-L-isoaspartate(D-aspartate) O-methyltransferase [Aureibaculum sp. 2210JD6-5]MDY7394059.1 protein-L-isoaspartate(D-aspartate) O-methyltransferase [Aureibaculum sp. 2210JD6-5]
MTAIACIFMMIGFGQEDYTAKREIMVKTQLKARGIKDSATLSAMQNVARHLFVPDNMKVHAYTDGALPIGEGQTISQPYIVAFMTEALQLKESDRVLEIGTGSGYQAAILATIVDSVYTIEIVKNLASESKDRLKELGYANITVKWGDGYHGWPTKAPFDAIMVTAGAESIPQPLLDQLKMGGKMIIPVGPKSDVSHLVLVTKKKNKITKKKLLPVRFVPFTREKKGGDN